VYGNVNDENEEDQGRQEDVICELIHVSLDSDRWIAEAEAGKEFTSLSYMV